MKRSALVLCFVLVALGLNAQSYYEIKTLGTQYSNQEIDDAFSSANFCGSHFQSKRNTLKFNDGTVIELLSGDELGTLTTSCIMPDDTKISECEYEIKGQTLVRKSSYAPTPQLKKEQMIKSN